uniref:Uncharacterized protein n=1 Tax=Helicotheca tamesis TaxID=374047 RepID=A0A7S2DYW4_9STRA|mmetsp:Transcript_11025/g.15299  ORF Transcript_11025/g.15299 Transcript_11025/m.15299 type:complete len:124 (+) Transcript_11025:169-540(+)|eukprot:CAMPEP_0185732742 /NCGR_PEP_ID=MMETSP1171-20130828/17355_1 /TAXON_ID=374046 /ORGANISM="Helicotheca tamensis, Strain CCMP826" /LENGTH=123 /DNA_ID=CAMNT_0028402311 /DNA_START=151 /DNA_END=525 /DNA_ORIENTATION=-
MNSKESASIPDSSPAQHLLRNSSLPSSPPQDESAYALVALIAVGVIVVFLALLLYVRRNHALIRSDSDMILPPVRSKRFTRYVEDKYHIVHKSQEKLFIENKKAAINKKKNADYGATATEEKA